MIFSFLKKSRIKREIDFCLDQYIALSLQRNAMFSDNCECDEHFYKNLNNFNSQIDVLTDRIEQLENKL